ncbi:xyloglucan endotransglucosylase/hydrolase protein 2-like [Tripterygium wilfordii]|uniref:xyloglucan endotransglucosylase/hydrolase protein 2-like n=1 Tax=Tripterygium wilfordii TaxID=458696 RepID=UPI0018F80181|nr:xyloglucan endotransglucosylase/hydrolase protein 2-like [Tripterygium wilfordii]
MANYFTLQCLLLASFLLIVTCPHEGSAAVSFNDNYYITWGNNHAQLLNQGTELQLTLDQTSGAGFESKAMFGSGSFTMRLKIPAKKSSGVVTAFYLISKTAIHDEIDFEFLGHNGAPYTLQTNVFSNNVGGREQKIRLWFDPTIDYHSYTILWNSHQIVLFVDNIPIRVFKNKADIGVSYPSQPMHVTGSLWNGTWAAGGIPIEWSQAPFQAYFQGFTVTACPLQDYRQRQLCYNPNLWWNRRNYWQLNRQQQALLERTRKSVLTYDYCTDKSRYPRQPPECLYNQ